MELPHQRKFSNLCREKITSPYRFTILFPLGVGSTYDLPLPNFQFELKSNQCQAMNY